MDKDGERVRDRRRRLAEQPVGVELSERVAVEGVNEEQLGVEWYIVLIKRGDCVTLNERPSVLEDRRRERAIHEARCVVVKVVRGQVAVAVALERGKDPSRRRAAEGADLDRLGGLVLSDHDVQHRRLHGPYLPLADQPALRLLRRLHLDKLLCLLPLRIERYFSTRPV